LLGRACDPASVLAADEAAFFRRLGGRSAHVALDGPARDVNGMYAEWFADAGIDVVLQRPDFYVFGTAATPDGAADLVRALRAALT